MSENTKSDNVYGRKYLYVVLIGREAIKIYADNISSVNDYLIMNGYADCINTEVRKDSAVSSKIDGVYTSEIKGELVVNGVVEKVSYKYYRINRGAIKTASGIKSWENRDKIPKYIYKFEWQGQRVSVYGFNRADVVNFFNNMGYDYKKDKDSSYGCPTKLDEFNKGIMIVEKLNSTVREVYEVEYERIRLSEEQRVKLVKGKYKYIIDLDGEKLELYGDTVHKALSKIRKERGIKHITKVKEFKLSDGTQRGIIKMTDENGNEKFYSVIRLNGAKL